MGYRVSNYYGKKHSKGGECDFLRLYEDCDLIFSNVIRPYGNHYTPQEIFAMVEKPNMKEDIKQAIERMKQEIAALEEQLQESEKEVIYKRGDRFYIGDDNDGEEHILAHVDNAQQGLWSGMFCLVSIEGGNRYTNPVKVADYTEVSVKEMLNLTNGESFQLIKR